MSLEKIIEEKIKDFRTGDQINISDKKELEYWCEKYNIVPDEIKRIITEVGPLVKEVEKRIRKKTRNIPYKASN